MNFSAPSPSFTTSCDSSSAARANAEAKSRNAGSSIDLTPLGAAPAMPVAANRTVSEVEVSPSTVMQLNVLATTVLRRRVRSLAGTAASVKKKASIVAMSGAIIPEPLAMPLMVTLAPPYRAEAVTVLGKVSVVSMARAASSHRSSAALSMSCGTTRKMSAGSNGSPITPVEAMKTSDGLHPEAAATPLATALTQATPACPVKAFAFPALTMIARALEPTWAAHHSTGAERVSDRVKAPAMVVWGSRSASITSGRSR